MSDEKVVGIIASVLQQKPEEITAKLASDEGVNELTEKINGLKIFTNEGYLQALNNYKNTVVEVFNKDKEKEIDTAIKNTRSSFERKILEKHGLQWEFGKDYKDASDMIEKIIELKAKPNKDVDDKKELAALQEALQKKEQEIEQIKTEYETRAQKDAASLRVNYALNELSQIIDVEENKLPFQLNVIKSEFERQFYIKIEEGKEVVVKNSDGLILRDEKTHTPKELKDILSDIAHSACPIKKGSPTGRGKQNKQDGANGSIDWSSFENFDQFIKSEKGKHIQIGSIEANELYEKFLKAKGNVA